MLENTKEKSSANPASPPAPTAEPKAITSNPAPEIKAKTSNEEKSTAPNAAPAKTGGEAAPKSEPFAKNFAALSRQEKRLQAMKKDIEAGRYVRKADIEAEFKKDPVAALAAFGLSYEDVTTHILNTQGTVDESKADEALRRAKELEKKWDNDKASAEKARIDEVFASHKSKISEYLEANKATYELSHGMKAADLVFSVIEKHFAKTKQVLSIEDAVKAVEADFESQLGELERFNKVKSRFAPPPPPAKEAGPESKGDGSQTAPAEKKEPKTLTNDLAFPALPSRTSVKESDEKIAEAAKLLRFK